MDTRQYVKERLGLDVRDISLWQVLCGSLIKTCFYVPIGDETRLLRPRQSAMGSAFAGDSASESRRPGHLRFLGEAVLSLCVARQLYLALPGASAGDLTIYRASLLANAGLAQMAEVSKHGAPLHEVIR
jgi:dsRNA-specific ribonuclease